MFATKSGQSLWKSARVRKSRERRDGKQMRKGMLYMLAMIVAIGTIVSFILNGQAAFNPQQGTFGAGVGTVPIATSKAGVSASVGSLSTFVSGRSGITLTSAISDKLAELEEKTHDDLLNRLTPAMVAAALTDTLHERLETVTNAEIEDMAAKSLRVSLDAGGITGWSSAVALRSTGETAPDAATFVAKAKEYRDESTAEAIAFRALLPGLIRDRIEAKLNELADALPSQYEDDSASPVQAFILAYSFVTDEPLEYSLTSLQDTMRQLADHLANNFGLTDSTSGRKPYGDQGYLYASPVKIFWDEPTVLSFLEKLEEAAAL
jgi:hypothetical protein